MAVNSGRPISGPLDWTSPVATATPDHARAWVADRGWSKGSFVTKVATGPVAVENLVVALWCSGAKSVVGPYREFKSPARNSTISVSLRPDPKAKAQPCWSGVGWKVAGRYVGFVWDAIEAPAPTSKAAAVSSAVAPYVSSLPYRISMDRNYFPPIPQLEVCYLSGATTRPNGRNDAPVACPDPRPIVDLGVWCQALRSTPADQAVPPAVVASIKAAGPCP